VRNTSLVRGRDVEPFVATPSAEILLPYDQARPGTPISESAMERSFPLTHAYFHEFYDALVTRRPFRNFDPQTGTPWEMYNVGAYTFARFKVVWREQASRFTAGLARPVHGRPVVPNHKLISVGLDDLEEASYLVAVMNSTLVGTLVDSYALELSLSSHVLDYVGIPRFLRSDAVHLELSSLGQRAINGVSPGERESLQTGIDDAAARLWNLPKSVITALREYRGAIAVETDIAEDDEGE
jgi:hypothetical protein